MWWLGHLRVLYPSKPQPFDARQLFIVIGPDLLSFGAVLWVFVLVAGGFFTYAFAHDVPLLGMLALWSGIVSTLASHLACAMVNPGIAPVTAQMPANGSLSVLQRGGPAAAALSPAVLRRLGQAGGGGDGLPMRAPSANASGRDKASGGGGGGGGGASVEDSSVQQRRHRHAAPDGGTDCVEGAAGDECAAVAAAVDVGSHGAMRGTALLPPATAGQHAHDGAGAGGGCFKYCDGCGGFVDDAAHHCIDCGVCFGGYDHHCPWVGTCIADRNMPAFWWFLSSIAVTLFMLMVGSFYGGIAGALREGGGEAGTGGALRGSSSSGIAAAVGAVPDR